MVSTVQLNYSQYSCSFCQTQKEGAPKWEEITSVEEILDIKPGYDTCKKCRSIFYCSVACQKQDWPRHRVECESLKAAGAGTERLKSEQILSLASFAYKQTSITFRIARNAENLSTVLNEINTLEAKKTGASAKIIRKLNKKINPLKEQSIKLSQENDSLKKQFDEVCADSLKFDAKVRRFLERHPEPESKSSTATVPSTPLLSEEVHREIEKFSSIRD